MKRSRHWLNWQHFKVLVAIERCRTAALGGHIDECTRCGHQTTISYNSCRNRHCPKCQANARNRWLEARRQQLLPPRYVHGVFTLPHLLAPLALQNKKLIYGLLFRTSADTLLEVARNPQRLGAEIGFFSVLHSWNQKLEFHPHLHCIVPAGGLSPDHTQWIHPRYPFLLPVEVLSRVFRGKFVAALKRAHARGQLSFRWRDSAHKNKKRKMTLSTDEFLRRFLLHTLPRGFVRIRHFGFLANRRRAELLPLCRQLLEAGSHDRAPTPPATESRPPATWRCPFCGGPMTLIERLTALQICCLSVQRRTFVDTS